MLVLGKDVEERVGGKSGADVLESQAGLLLAFHPKVDGGDLVTQGQDGVGEIQLAVELEGPGLDRQGSRGRAGLRGFVDDPARYAEPGQPQSQDEAGGTGTHDQNVAVFRHTRVAPTYGPKCEASRVVARGRSEAW